MFALKTQGKGKLLNSFLLFNCIKISYPKVLVKKDCTIKDAFAISFNTIFKIFKHEDDKKNLSVRKKEREKLLIWI
jgi:hypothetical protein